MPLRALALVINVLVMFNTFLMYFATVENGGCLRF